MRRQMPDGSYSNLGPAIGRSHGNGSHGNTSFVTLGPPNVHPEGLGRSWRNDESAPRPHFPGARRRSTI